MLARSFKVLLLGTGGVRKSVLERPTAAAGTWARTRRNNKLEEQQLIRSRGISLEDGWMTMISRGFVTLTNGDKLEDQVERRSGEGLVFKRSGGGGVRFKSAKSEKLLSNDALESYEKLRASHPELTEYSHDELMAYLGLMSSYGFTDEQAAEIVVKCPSLMTSYKEKIPAVNSWLTNAYFKETERIALIHRHPGMVFMKRNHFSSRIGLLNSYLTLNETQQVILQSIGALVDHESVVVRKLEYLIKVMSHSTKKIVSCRVLDHKFSRMRMRHEFLIRAGLYKPIAYRKLIKVEEKEKATKEKRPHYFTPYDIVCSNDSYFLKYCTKGALSINELAAFEELFEKEVAAEDDKVNTNEEDESIFEDNPEQAMKVTIEEKRQAEADQFYF